MGANLLWLGSRSPFGAGRRSGGAFISSVIHHIPIPGWGQAAERRIPQCPSTERRLPQGIISPPCHSPCSRRYPYACHAPKGLGRGAPEGKGYATTSVRCGLGGASMISTLVTHRGYLWGNSRQPWTGQRADINACARRSHQPWTDQWADIYCTRHSHSPEQAVGW